MVEYSYDAWGNHTIKAYNKTVANANPFRYRSYFYDTDTKLYYLQTRYYDPEVGRFLNMDAVDNADPSTLGGLNLYAYCNNNPVMYVDPTGTSFIATFIVGSLIAGAICGSVNAVVTASKGGDDLDIFGAFAGGFITGIVLGAAAILGGGLAVGAYTATAMSLTGTATFLTVGTFLGGGLSYVVEKEIKGEKIVWEEAAKQGGLTMLQGLFSYGVGYALGGAGLWDSLKPGNGFFNSISSNGLFNGTLSYFSANAYPIVMRTFIKQIFTFPWNLIKP